MIHRRLATRMLIALISAAVMLSVPGCTQNDTPLPSPMNVSVQLGSEAQGNDGIEGTVIVSWDAGTDGRVEGYAIYRAEQGVGDTIGERTDYKLQAVTIATRYLDDEVRTTERYPTTRYFYRISVIGPEGRQGPMSEEISIDYQATK